MAGVPGQRAVQHPMRAAAAVQRVLGRAAQGGGGPVSPVGVAMFGGAYFTVDLTGGVSRLVPRGPVPLFPVPVPEVPVVPPVADAAVVVDVAVAPVKPPPKRTRKRRGRADER